MKEEKDYNKDIEEEINENRQKILDEGKVIEEPTSFDFDEENNRKREIIKKERLRKMENKKRVKNKITKILLIALGVYIFIVILAMIVLLFNVNNNLEDIKNINNNITIDDVREETVLYTNTRNSITVDVNSITKEDNRVSVKYTIKNDGKRIQPLIKKISMENYNSKNLIAMNQYSNMISDTLNREAVCQGFIVFTNIDNNKKICDLNGYYNFTIPFINEDGIVEVSMPVQVK